MSLRMRKADSGFTLIEMMVGMVVGMIMLIATAAVFANTKKAFVFQNAQSEIAQEGRFGVDLLRRLIGQAGYRATPTTTAAYAVPAAGATTPPFTAAVEMDTTGAILKLRFQSDGTQIGCDGAQIAATSDMTTQFSEVWIKYDATNKVLQCGLTSGTASTAASAPSSYVDLIGTSNSATNPSPVQVDGFTPSLGFDTSITAAGTNAAGCTYPGSYQGDCLAKEYDTFSTSLGSSPYDWQRVVAVRVCVKIETINNVVPSGQTYSYVDCAGALHTGQSGTTLIRTITATSRVHNLLNA